MHSTTRQDAVFDADSFNKDAIRVDVIGCGVLGSRLIKWLAFAGVQKIHVYDDDIVDSENICNQHFPEKYIGTPKVEAIQSIVADSVSSITIIPHNQKVETGTRLGGAVFVMVDSMLARRSIWKNNICMQPHVDMMFEARLGVDSGRVYAVNPANPPEIEWWKNASDYTDAQVIPNTCGTSTSVGPTADIIAGMVQWQFFRWYQEYCGEKVHYTSSQIFALHPRFAVISTDFRPLTFDAK